MNRKKIIVGIVATAFVLLMVSSVLSQSTVHHSGHPKVDTVYYKAYPGAEPDVIVDEFLTEVTDWIGGPSRSDLYDSVVTAGHKISPLDPMAEFTFFPINCRDYKVTSGEPNFPLNNTAFRLAQSYVYGMDDKDQDIFDYYNTPFQFALGNPCPPAQEPWYDESVQMPNTDYDAAWSILQGAGWEVDGDGWLALNGRKARPDGTIEIWYSTGALVYPEGPGGGWVRNWNEFLTYIGAVGPQFEILATDFSTLVVDLLSGRDFDIIGIGLTNLGVNVDWIFDCFHSANDVDWGWNFCGIHDADFDVAGETIMESMSEAEIIDAASNFQAKFVYELMPWLPAISGVEFCTTARDARGELMNIVSMANYGPSNDYSWCSLTWRGEPGTAWPGGSYQRALGDEPHTMNPYTEDTLYGWQFMDGNSWA
jgi:hypothetical protein